MIENLINKFINLSKKKIIWRKNEKTKILLFDNNHAKLHFENISYKVYNFNEINLRYFLNALAKYFFYKHKIKKSLRDIYFIEHVKSYDPDIAIGHEIIKGFFKFKTYFPKKIAITYQFSSYWYYSKSGTKRRLEDLTTDYFLIFSDLYKEYFGFINTKFIVAGSVKNNQIKLSNKSRTEYDIMYISEFRKPVRPYYDGSNNMFSSMTVQESCSSFIMKILKTYCEKNNKRLCIATTSTREDKIHNSKMKLKDELEFYKRDYNNFYIENIDSYNLANKSNLIICLTSNLGPELLARKKKVLFLNIHHFFGLNWPFLPNDKEEGAFWYKGQDKEKISNKIDYLINLDERDWLKELEKADFNMPFDPQNNILKKLIQNIKNE